MKNLSLHLENCYGINKLAHQFNFEESKAHLIYAPNGVMKSSLALTFEDIAEGKSTKDRIFNDRTNHRDVQLDGQPIQPEEIFVIQRMKESSFGGASTILANEALKQAYIDLNEKINGTKSDFIKSLQPFFGVKESLIEDIIIKTYGKGLFETLLKLKPTIDQINDPMYTHIQFNEVLNDKAIKFLESKDFSKKIHDYIKLYDDLVNKNETLFVKHTFNHYNADTVTKSLKENKFFLANHKVKIKDVEIDNVAELEELIKSEREKVLGDPALKSKFEEIDKALNNNNELRNFRSYIEQNQEIIKEFADVKKFRKKLIENYIAKLKDEFNVLLKLYTETESQRKEIIDQANMEQEDWKKVIRIFNQRFSVPFELKVGNQHEVILNDQPLSLLFKYQDAKGSVEIGGPQLQESLSTGEQRVFYLLNIIFEIEARRKLQSRQLIIVDDIADSFDYRNKYAIIQYLKDISEDKLFYLVVLTHNFDFYKTFKSRLGGKINYSGNWMAIKDNDVINLVPGEKNDVFPLLRKSYASCDFSFVSCIPFARNLIEFTKGTDNAEYLLLTSLLHVKPARQDVDIAATSGLKKGEIHEVFNRLFCLEDKCVDPEKNALELIFETAAELVEAKALDYTDLKVKLCISLAIRLKAEQYMLNRITNQQFLGNILKKQTGKIVQQFKNEFGDETEAIEILDAVNLMTAENIHINSFMYEPLMDLSIDHLKNLYQQVFRFNVV